MPTFRAFLILLLVSSGLSVSHARDGALREIKSAIDDALEAARDADRECRDEVVDLIKDAKASARDLRAGNKRDRTDLEATLEKAIRRAKKSCPKKVTAALADALDKIDDLAGDKSDKPAAKPEPPKPQPYEPTMEDVGNAKTACDKAVRFTSDSKPCLDATLALMRGPYRGIALQVPASCSSTLRDEMKFCMAAASKSKRSPVEVNAYCAKNHRFTSEIKQCLTEWGSSGGEAKPAKKAMLEVCSTSSDCAGEVCLTSPKGRDYCTTTCRVARDCEAAGGGRVTDWRCEATQSGRNVCQRSGI